MNLFIVMFFQNLEWFKGGWIADSITNNYVQEFTYEGETVYALAVGRQMQQGSIHLDKSTASDFVRQQLGCEAAVFGCHGLAVSFDYASDCRPEVIVIKNKLAVPDVRADFMVSEFLRSVPPIWTRNLRKRGPIQIALRRDAALKELEGGGNEA